MLSVSYMRKTRPIIALIYLHRFSGDLKKRKALRARKTSLPELPSEPYEIKDITADISSKESISKSTPFKDILPRSAENGIEHEVLKQQGSDLSINACADGSVRLLPATFKDEDGECDDSWVFLNGNVIADAAERHLHYYENTMSEIGVSRLRLSGKGTVPNGARHV